MFELAKWLALLTSGTGFFSSNTMHRANRSVSLCVNTRSIASSMKVARPFLHAATALAQALADPSSKRLPSLYRPRSGMDIATDMSARSMTIKKKTHLKCIFSNLAELV